MEAPMVQVEVTPAAEEQVRKIMARQNKEGQALRLFVQGGGCSGLTYGMTFGHQESGDWNWQSLKSVCHGTAFCWVRSPAWSWVQSSRNGST